MASHRAYLHPYRWTSLGLSLVEAMTLGSPVLVLAATARRRGRARRGAGVVSADVDVLAAAARRLLDDPDEAAALGAAGPAARPRPVRPGPVPRGLGPAAGRPRMKIDMVSEHASPLAVLGGHDAGGQNVHVAQLSRALAARGHAVRVHTRRDAPDLPARVRCDGGVEVVHLDAGPAAEVPKDDLLPHVPALAASLAAHWRRHGPPDVVHAHFWMSALAARAAVAETGAHVPVVVTFHALGAVKRRYQGAEDTSPPERLGLERGLLDEVDAVVATCRDEVEELLALGAPPERLHVVPCGVDLDRFRPDAAAGHEPAPGPTWTPGRRRLLSLGRLVPRKGVDTDGRGPGPAARGGARRRRRPGRRATWTSDPDVRRLRATAARAGVLDRVRVLGRVDQAGAAALLRESEVLVTVPWYEPFGIVPLEAMACGTPVVASAVGGMLDTVEDGRTGRLVPARDPAALAATLADLLADPARLRAAGRAGRRRAAERYSWPAVAERTEAVYAALRRGRPGATRGATSPAPRPRPRPCPGPVPARPRTGGAMTPFGTLQEHLDDLSGALASLACQADELEEWGAALARRLDGGRLLVAGNGGSAAEAQHLTAELVGRFEGERRPLSAIALHGDTSSVTAICNDYGPDEVFARQVEAHGRPGDVLLLLSTSGRSGNVLCAASRARGLGLAVWALTGPAPNPLAAAADRTVSVDGGLDQLGPGGAPRRRARAVRRGRAAPGAARRARRRLDGEPAAGRAPVVDLRRAVPPRLGVVR